MCVLLILSQVFEKWQTTHLPLLSVKKEVSSLFQTSTWELCYLSKEGSHADTGQQLRPKLHRAAQTTETYRSAARGGGRQGSWSNDPILQVRSQTLWHARTPRSHTAWPVSPSRWRFSIRYQAAEKFSLVKSAPIQGTAFLSPSGEIYLWGRKSQDGECYCYKDVTNRNKHDTHHCNDTRCTTESKSVRSPQNCRYKLCVYI